MTALSDLLNEAKLNGRNVDYWVEQAGNAGHAINRATVYKCLKGNHAKNPSEETLRGLAFVFDLDIRSLRKAVGKPAGELGAYKPTSEADRLSQEQRAALDLLIKAIVRGGAEDADSPAANEVPAPGPGQQPGNVRRLSPVPSNLRDTAKKVAKPRPKKPPTRGVDISEE